MKKKTKGKLPHFTNQLLDLLAQETGCTIQHNGCTCNTCFHTWAEDELGLNDILAHMFWMIVLALRGDYEQEEILCSNKKNLKEWIRRINDIVRKP